MYNSALATLAAVLRDVDGEEKGAVDLGGVVALTDLSDGLGFARPMYESAK